MSGYCLKPDWRWMGEHRFPGEALIPISGQHLMAREHRLRRRSFPGLSGWVQMGEQQSPWERQLQNWKWLQENMRKSIRMNLLKK